MAKKLLNQQSEMSESDPTEDPTFRRVVQHFLKTPHKLHKPITKKSRDKKREWDSKKSGGGRRQV